MDLRGRLVRARPASAAGFARDGKRPSVSPFPWRAPARCSTALRHRGGPARAGWGGDGGGVDVIGLKKNSHQREGDCLKKLTLYAHVILRKVN